MKQLRTVDGWQCTKGAGVHFVEGTVGTYTIYISLEEQTPHTCNCPHFTMRGLANRFETCKHIDKVLRQVCGWNSVIFGRQPSECPNIWRHSFGESSEFDACSVCGQTNLVCPRCGSKLEKVKVAVG